MRTVKFIGFLTLGVLAFLSKSVKSSAAVNRCPNGTTDGNSAAHPSVGSERQPVTARSYSADPHVDLLVKYGEMPGAQ